jgi:predicted nucleotidyltransferase
LQFVGFFFLRLYVANELDLKHNKNEMTNIEMKMIGLQVARVLRDASSKKEIVKVFAHTERNFVLKKGERTISSEELSEYNDLKSVLEGLISKIPGARKSS